MKKRLETVHPIFDPDEWETDPDTERRLRENTTAEVGPNGEMTITFHFPVAT